MNTKRIKIITNIDRPHITYEFLSVLYKHNIGIMMMEVYAYIIYMKLPPVESNLWEEILKDFQEIEGFESVEEIDLIELEKKDIEIKRVLDLIPQGIAILNRTGNIKYSNNYIAERIFKTTSSAITNIHINEYMDDEDLNHVFDAYKEPKFIIDQEVSIDNQLYTLNINPFGSDENAFTGYILHLRDATEHNIFDNHIGFEDIIGESNSLKKIINQAELYAQSDSSVLITGESGTGKELFARSIHNLSSRYDKPFISINCAAIPEQLLESELFGYEDDTFFANKAQGKKGIFEIGQGGSIFLDEIGEMPPHLQSKLLRVLQTKQVKRIGGQKENPIDIRFICASSQDLTAMIEKGEFRPDLFYRINILSLEIPPLRERKDDIPVLVEYFIKQNTKTYGKDISSITPLAMEKLLNYHWVGNIRELQNVMERAVAISEETNIRAKDIIIDENNSQHEDEFAKELSLKDTLEKIEREIIINTLRKSESIRAAARSLDVTHTLLINRIKKYNILDEEWKLKF